MTGRPTVPEPIRRDAARRLRQFILADLAATAAGAAVCVAAYVWVTRSGWILALAGICAVHGVVLALAARPASRNHQQRAVTIVCLGSWGTALVVTFINPITLPIMVLTAQMPVVFALSYVSRRRLWGFTAATAGCVLILGMLSRLQHVTGLSDELPGALDDVVLIGTPPAVVALILLIVWQHAATLEEHVSVAAEANTALHDSRELLAQRAEELAASRSRLVATTDAERRRIERDLHDGAQQHLVALAVNLRLAHQLAERDPAQSTAMLPGLSDQLQEAIAEIRRLAHGIYPPQLAAQGLGHALTVAAAKSAVPTRVNTDGIGRYLPELEAALYFCCLEALQNTAKHGGDTATATITARETSADGLIVTITDTGTGFDPTITHTGTGLTNMADRLAVHAGDITVHSTPHHGTAVTLTIPKLTAPTGRDSVAPCRQTRLPHTQPTGVPSATRDA